MTDRARYGGERPEPPYVTDQQHIADLEAELEDCCAEQDRLRSLNAELLVALGDLADSVGGLDGEYPQMEAPLAEARLLIARAESA